MAACVTGDFLIILVRYEHMTTCCTIGREFWKTLCLGNVNPLRSNGPIAEGFKRLYTIVHPALDHCTNIS